MIKENEYCSKAFKIKSVMTENGQEDFWNCPKCWICKKICKKVEVK